MDSPPSAPPRVFLSYSWDSDAHSKRVLELADRLRGDGVDAWIDQYETFPERGWPRWMGDEIERARFVIVIASEKYSQRFAAQAPRGTGLGANWEGAIITQDLYEAGTVNTKFLPAVFDAADLAHIPKPLRSYSHFRLEDETGYDKLYRLLTGQPEVEAPALGSRRERPPRQRLAPLAIPAAQTPTATPLRSLHQLPPPPDLTGREPELADLAGRILGGAAGAAICGARLQGMGGVGKTAFAIELCHRLKDRWPAAQLFLDLRGADPQKRPPVPPVEAMSRVIHAFHPDARLPDDVESLAPHYHSVLADAGAVLLLFDDATDESQVAPLLPPPNCLVIVTSRARFDLPRVAAHGLDCLTPDQSRALLFLHTENRLEALADEAAQLCGHLPLALRVFAGTVMKSVIPPERVVERLRKGVLRLDKVDAVFEVSYELLSEELRRRWLILSIFTTSFTLDAAAALWEETEDAAEGALESLVFGSLVEWNKTTGRFRLHDLVRQYCAGKLPAAEVQAARMRHAKHYVAVAENADALYKRGGGSVRQGLDLFDAERAHLDAAFAWLSPCSDHATARVLLQLVNAVVHTGALRFHPREHIRWLEAQQKGASLMGSRQAEGAALGNLGNAYRNLGETRKAIALYERRIAIAGEIGDRRGKGVVLGNLGLAYAALGETRKAIALQEQRIAIVREIGDRRGEGNALGNLGNAYAALGETRKAIDFYEQQLIIVREIGDRRGEGAALSNLGAAYSALGETRKAISFYEQALAIVREIGDRRSEGAALGNLGNAYSALGETRKAISFYEQALAIVREIGDRRGEGNTLWNSAGEFWKSGEREEAISRAEVALAIFEAIESPSAAMVRAALARLRGEGV